VPVKDSEATPGVQPGFAFLTQLSKFLEQNSSNDTVSIINLDGKWGDWQELFINCLAPQQTSLTYKRTLNINEPESSTAHERQFRFIESWDGTKLTLGENVYLIFETLSLKKASPALCAVAYTMFLNKGGVITPIMILQQKSSILADKLQIKGLTGELLSKSLETCFLEGFGEAQILKIIDNKQLVLLAFRMLDALLVDNETNESLTQNSLEKIEAYFFIGVFMILSSMWREDLNNAMIAYLEKALDKCVNNNNKLKNFLFNVKKFDEIFDYCFSKKEGRFVKVQQFSDDFLSGKFLNSCCETSTFGAFLIPSRTHIQSAALVQTLSRIPGGENFIIYGSPSSGKTQHMKFLQNILSKNIQNPKEYLPIPLRRFSRAQGKLLQG
jgi:hypothetical protein